MALASARLAEFADGGVQATLAYNDTSLTVDSFTVVSNSPLTITVTFTKADDPQTVITAVLDPAPEDGSTIVTLDQIGGGWYYAPMELSEEDPNYGKPNVMIGFSDSPAAAAAAQAAQAAQAVARHGHATQG